MAFSFKAAPVSVTTNASASAKASGLLEPNGMVMEDSRVSSSTGTRGSSARYPLRRTEVKIGSEHNVQPRSNVHPEHLGSKS